MGFSITALAQKARTATLIADSDLNLGNYDLIATDVKGDTAEFDEFVGGVGNFSNVLGSGNLDIEGTGNIKGLTTFQNAVQVNGALHVEGSINNVNIADNGEITTAQGVNGADFNGAVITSNKFNGATIDASGNVTGAKGVFSGAVTGASFNNRIIKTGNITITPTNTIWFLLPSHIYYQAANVRRDAILTVLPPIPNVTYSGTIRLYNKATYNSFIYVYDATTSAPREITIGSGYYDLPISNIPCLTLSGTDLNDVSICTFTMS